MSTLKDIVLFGVVMVVIQNFIALCFNFMSIHYTKRLLQIREIEFDKEEGRQIVEGTAIAKFRQLRVRLDEFESKTNQRFIEMHGRLDKK